MKTSLGELLKIVWSVANVPQRGHFLPYSHFPFCVCFYYLSGFGSTGANVVHVIYSISPPLWTKQLAAVCLSACLQPILHNRNVKMFQRKANRLHWHTSRRPFAPDVVLQKVQIRAKTVTVVLGRAELDGVGSRRKHVLSERCRKHQKSQDHDWRNAETPLFTTTIPVGRHRGSSIMLVVWWVKDEWVRVQNETLNEILIQSGSGSPHKKAMAENTHSRRGRSGLGACNSKICANSGLLDLTLHQRSPEVANNASTKDLNNNNNILLFPFCKNV